MSETVHYKGNLLRVRFNNKVINIEDKCRLLMEEKNIEKKYNTYKESFLESSETYDKYLIYKDNIYLIEKEYIDPDNDISIGIKVDEDKISFETRFYNGGTCLSEMLEEIMDKL